jgi:hypothetical protein
MTNTGERNGVQLQRLWGSGISGGFAVLRWRRRCIKMTQGNRTSGNGFDSLRSISGGVNYSWDKTFTANVGASFTIPIPYGSLDIFQNISFKKNEFEQTTHIRGGVSLW